MRLTDKQVENTKFALKKGDEKAFEVFYNAYYDDLFFYINGFTNDPPKTKDILQDTFVKLWNIRYDIKENQSIRGFLFRTAHNLFIDQYRRHQRKLKMINEFVIQSHLDNMVEDPDIKAERITQIRETIEKIPPKCREIFKMSKLQGLKYHEIAERLGLSVKTVEAQMGKAFSILRKAIKK